MSEMRILTVRQPWAWAIIHGGKNVENRVRNVAGGYRGPVAIHVAHQEDETAYSVPVLRDALETPFRDWRMTPGMKPLRSEPAPKYLGRIIGVVDLVDVHQPADCWSHGYAKAIDAYQTNREAFDAMPDNGAGGIVGKVRHCSPWAEDPGDRMHHLVLANPRPLTEPISYKGALGLRRLDEETTAAVWGQIVEDRC